MRKASNGPPEGTVATSAPSASASRGACPKSSQRAPAAYTRAARIRARNSPAGTVPRSSSVRLGHAGTSQVSSRDAGVEPIHLEPRVGHSRRRPPGHEDVESLRLGVGNVGDRHPVALLVRGPEASTGGETTSAGAAPAATRPPRPR